MNSELYEILLLEDKGLFYKAYEEYNLLYTKDKNDYDVWKHFYFFLWISIEDAPNDFAKKINIRASLKLMLDDGKRMFSNNADFNFIAGYTVSIFPYEYGDYEDLEEEGRKMLLEATKLEPKNLIYRMAYHGTFEAANNKMYDGLRIDAAPKVLETFSGIGFLNKYFREVLYRIKKKYF